jgi:hypothetical protein
MRRQTSHPAASMLQAFEFAFEVQSVVALRLLRIAAGGTEAAAETQRMITEKAEAVWQSQIAAGLAIASGRGSEAVAAAAFRPYRRAVKANRRRLSAS